MTYHLGLAFILAVLFTQFNILTISQYVQSFLFTRPAITAFDVKFLDSDTCPNLRLIRKLPRSKDSNTWFPSEGGLLPLLLPLLPKPQSGEATNLTHPLPNLFGTFKERARKYGLHKDFDDTQEFLARRKLTLKAPYKFAIRMLDYGGVMTQSRAPKIVMEKVYPVDVVWDRHSFRIEGLPNFRAEAWWRDPSDGLLTQNRMMVYIMSKS